MIDTREELINALQEACEIEHGLMVQYLYAALTMKRRLDEGLTTRQQMLNRNWLAALLTVAREEMGHFGTVCHLLAAIGAGPKFGRPNMPRKLGYYPFPFDLMPFNDTALYRFMVFELPRGMSLPPEPGADLRALPQPQLLGPVPDPLDYEFVGELYAKISNGFNEIAEQDLFVGPPAAQSEREWGVDVITVSSRATAIDAINRIIEQGEGTPGDRENSHYDRFADTRLAFFDAGRYAAARAVPVNPATREHRDADGPVTLIVNPASREAVETFNSAYGVMLLMLQHFFSLAPEPGPLGALDSARRIVLQNAARRLMTVAVRPLAEIVSDLPLNDPTSPERAAPSFELYGDVSLSPYPQARWTILLERLDALVDACRALSSLSPRAANVAETVGYLRRPVANAATGAV